MKTIINTHCTISLAFLILFSFGGLFIGNCYSQTPITITGADLPQAGDNFILANDTTPNITLGAPGSTPQNWNFSGISNHYYKAAVYDSTANTPFAAEFQNSNISTFGPAEYFGALYGGAPVGAGYDGYMFWNSDSSGLKIIGWKAIDGPYAYIPIHENPTELLIGTPATFGTSFYDTARWDLFMGNVPADVDTTWVSRRTKSLVCDAWGSMSTPFGNFPDMIRIHETVVEIDSAIATFSGTTVYQTEIFRDTMNNYIFMANGIGYPLAIIHADKNNNIKDIEYLIDTTCSVYTEIFGTIMDSNGTNISEGTVYLYQFVDALTPFALADSTTIDSSGFYGFYNVWAGQYLIVAEAGITTCSSCVPTYFGNVTYWNNAGWISTFCIDSILADINMSQILPMTGSGFCSGLIQFGIGKTAGDPVPGVEISLEQIPGGIKSHATTDQTGNFSFTNVNPGKYRLLVDVPGLPMDSTYEFTVSSTDSAFTNLNFTIDTTQGSGGIFVGYPLSAKEKINITPGFLFYPNPAKNKFTIEAKEEMKNTDIIIMDVFGNIVFSINNFNGNSLSIDSEKFSSGLYFWNIIEENKIPVSGKLSILK